MFFVGLTGWFVVGRESRKLDVSQVNGPSKIKPPRPTGHPSLAKEGSLFMIFSHILTKTFHDPVSLVYPP